MAILLRPGRGGFLRPFGCGWFIREFLLGHAPEGSPAIDLEVGACQEDIFYHYKMALLRAYAEDAVAWENEDRIKRGKTIYGPEEYAERVDWHLRRIPYKCIRLATTASSGTFTGSSNLAGLNSLGVTSHLPYKKVTPTLHHGNITV